MGFIWDPVKAETNYRDHGVYFEDAEHVHGSSTAHPQGWIRNDLY